MKIDFQFFFQEYNKILSQVDLIVEKVQKDFSDLIECKTGCSDCCHALFDVTLIEAIYINYLFNKKINNNNKKTIIEFANKIDRKIHKIKREAQNFIKKKEKSSEQVLYEMSTYRTRCPLLNSRNLCEIYEFRPITCRIYGTPTSFLNKGHTCGLSKFKTGKSYPTINLDIINNKLFLLSEELANKIESKYIELGRVLMPISMVLLTDFNSDFLGIRKEKLENEV